MGTHIYHGHPQIRYCCAFVFASFRQRIRKKAIGQTFNFLYAFAPTAHNNASMWILTIYLAIRLFKNDIFILVSFSSNSVMCLNLQVFPQSNASIFFVFLCSN